MQKLAGYPLHAAVAVTTRAPLAGTRSVAPNDTYFEQLDALRAFAVLVVIWQHAGAGISVIEFGLHGVGVYGVWLFFVLSGFLITGILLRVRDRIDAGATTLREALRTFYCRRFLRIFPVYYLLLALVGGFRLAPGFRDLLGWHLLYLSNWVTAIRNEWPSAAGPLWSLSVEEQFYLLWPLFILLVPRRRLCILMAGIVALAIFWRVGTLTMTLSTIRTLTPTPANFDTLGAGALLAWHRHNRPRSTRERSAYTRLALTVGVGLLLGTVLVSAVGHDLRMLVIIEGTSAALIGVWLVDRTANGFGGRARRIMTFAPLAFLGRISYGMYLSHSVVIWGLRQWPGTQALTARVASDNGFVFFLVVLFCTLVIASLAWYGLETPVNALKRYFPYHDAPGRPPE